RDVTLTTADGVRLRAWWLPAKKGVPVKGTVLYLHGNGGNLSWHLGGTWWLPAEVPGQVAAVAVQVEHGA
ncbi:hypothetical protein ACV350_32740, partial [Pseudomonas aeruginosa]